MPVHPARSLQRATSATRWAYVSQSPSEDCGQVEKISRLIALVTRSSLLPRCGASRVPLVVRALCMGGAIGRLSSAHPVSRGSELGRSAAATVCGATPSWRTVAGRADTRGADGPVFAMIVLQTLS